MMTSVYFATVLFLSLLPARIFAHPLEEGLHSSSEAEQDITLITANPQNGDEPYLLTRDTTDQESWSPSIFLNETTTSDSSNEINGTLNAERISCNGPSTPSAQSNCEAALTAFRDSFQPPNQRLTFYKAPFPTPAHMIYGASRKLPIIISRDGCDFKMDLKRGFPYLYSSGDQLIPMANLLMDRCVRNQIFKEGGSVRTAFRPTRGFFPGNEFSLEIEPSLVAS